MCRPVSGWAALVNGEPVLWVSETSESHTATATEFNLRDTGTHRLGAWECYPNVKSPSHDTDTWIVEWDSDATAGLRGEPDWSADERAAVERAIRRHVKRYVVADGTHEWRGCRMFAFGTAVVRGQTGGKCWCYGTAQSHAQAGGECWCFGNARSHGQTGGECRCYGNAQSHAQAGGECRCFSTSQSHGPTGGECLSYGNARKIP